jgi:hypothetical protein
MWVTVGCHETEHRMMLWSESKFKKGHLWVHKILLAWRFEVVRQSELVVRGSFWALICNCLGTATQAISDVTATNKSSRHQFRVSFVVLTTFVCFFCA